MEKAQNNTYRVPWEYRLSDYYLEMIRRGTSQFRSKAEQ